MTIEDIELKDFTLIRQNFKTKSTDLCFDLKDNIGDFIALGILCLHKSIFKSENKEIRIFRQDSREFLSTGCLYFKNKQFDISFNALFTAGMEYVEDIANYIGGKKYFNNMLLGMNLSSHILLYSRGETLGKATLKLNEILPHKFDMADTKAAQRLAFELINWLFEETVKPYENLH